MNGLDLTWASVAIFGLVTTILLWWDTLVDIRMAPKHLRGLAIQISRRELLRVVKVSMLLVAIGIIFLRHRIGDELMIAIRNGIMVAVIALLTANSFWDLAYRWHVRKGFRKLYGKREAEKKAQK